MVTPKYNGLAGPKFDMLCAKVLWMMGDCRSPVVKTRTQNLFTSRSGLHKWSQSMNYRKKMAKD